MAIKKMTGASSATRKRLMPTVAKNMGAPASARQPKVAPGVSATKNMGSPASTNRTILKKVKDKSYTKVEATRLNKQSKPKSPSMPAGKPKAMPAKPAGRKPLTAKQALANKQAMGVKRKNSMYKGTKGR